MMWNKVLSRHNFIILSLIGVTIVVFLFHVTHIIKPLNKFNIPTSKNISKKKLLE